MKITFFVGNGFDVSAGMKTSYKDFYKWYVKQETRSPSIQRFKNSIDKNAKELWSDFEAGLGEYTEFFSTDSARDFISIFRNARDCLANYLKEEVRKYIIPCYPSPKIEAFCDGIINFYQDLNRDARKDVEYLIDTANSVDFQFVSFNYTDCLDRCITSAVRTLKNPRSLSKSYKMKWSIEYIDKLSIAPSVIHVHGTIKDNPIIGVSEAEQIKNKNLREYKGFPELMIKSRADEIFKRKMYEKISNSIATSQIICLWGISIGKTDSVWWEKIGNWLKKDNNRHLLIFWYTNSPQDSYGLYMAKEEALCQFLSTSKLRDSDLDERELGKIKDRIHIILNTNNVLKITFDPLESKYAGN